MAKSSTPVLDNDVKDSSINSSIIYISILLCIIAIGAYFMYKVYKKLQKLNEEVITITTKGDELDSSTKETSRQIDSLGENFKKYYREFKNLTARQNSHEEIPFNNNKKPEVENPEEENPEEGVEPVTVDLNNTD
jgi:peptidoglycan hydrolase CwlO-like protein